MAHDLAPEYTVNLIGPYNPPRTLRLSRKNLLYKPRFNHKGYKAWSNLL